jgi:hypothetical protein
MVQPAGPNEGRSSSVTIGLRDLYDMIQTVSTGYTALSAKLDTALIQQTLQAQNIISQMSDMRHDINDHEMRMRAQESRPYITPRGVWTGVGVIATVISVVFTILQVVLHQ